MHAPSGSSTEGELELAAAQARLAELLREHFVPGTGASAKWRALCAGCREAEAVSRRIVELRQHAALTERELFAAHGAVL